MPFGSEPWNKRTARRLGLESTFRPRGPAEKSGGKRSGRAWKIAASPFAALTLSPGPRVKERLYPLYAPNCQAVGHGQLRRIQLSALRLACRRPAPEDRVGRGGSLPQLSTAGAKEPSSIGYQLDGLLHALRRHRSSAIGGTFRLRGRWEIQLLASTVHGVLSGNGWGRCRRRTGLPIRILFREAAKHGLGGMGRCCPGSLLHLRGEPPQRREAVRAL